MGSIADLNRLPSALFVVDVLKEHIAVREANRLGIPVFAMVDTNSNPNDVDFVIPANDDASKSIEVVLDAVCGAIAEGLEERKAEKLMLLPRVRMLLLRKNVKLVSLARKPKMQRLPK